MGVSYDEARARARPSLIYPTFLAYMLWSICLVIIYTNIQTIVNTFDSQLMPNDRVIIASIITFIWCFIVSGIVPLSFDVRVILFLYDQQWAWKILLTSKVKTVDGAGWKHLSLFYFHRHLECAECFWTLLRSSSCKTVKDDGRVHSCRRRLLSL